MLRLLTLFEAAGTAAVMLYVMRQCRKPSGPFGRALARGMNASHDTLTQWGLSHLTNGSHAYVLDVGCGGGRTIETLLSRGSDGRVFGVDYSPASVAVARARNRESIERGRVQIQEGSVSSLPFPDEMFDLVTAVETHYYWPDLPTDVREVMRVLRPGGAFMIIAETYRGRRNDWLYRPVMRGVLRANYLTADAHRRLLSEAGYRDAAVFEEKSRGWICAFGYK